jgi:predicted flavoprotein YhiN
LGAGAAGVVSLATHKETGERVAIKDIGRWRGHQLYFMLLERGKLRLFYTVEYTVLYILPMVHFQIANFLANFEREQFLQYFRKEIFCKHELVFR